MFTHGRFLHQDDLGAVGLRLLWHCWLHQLEALVPVAQTVQNRLQTWPDEWGTPAE